MDESLHFIDPVIALRELPVMALMAPGPWELSEIGYPSEGCGAPSSDTQARFHSGLRDVADDYDTHQHVQRVRSQHKSSDEVAAYASYYRIARNVS